MITRRNVNNLGEMIAGVVSGVLSLEADRVRLITFSPNSRRGYISFTYNVKNETLSPFYWDNDLNREFRKLHPLDILRAELEPEFYAVGPDEIQLSVVVYPLPALSKSAPYDVEEWSSVDWEDLGCKPGVYNTLGQDNK